MVSKARINSFFVFIRLYLISLIVSKILSGVVSKVSACTDVCEAVQDNSCFFVGFALSGGCTVSVIPLFAAACILFLYVVFFIPLRFLQMIKVLVWRTLQK